MVLVSSGVPNAAYTAEFKFTASSGKEYNCIAYYGYQEATYQEPSFEDLDVECINDVFFEYYDYFDDYEEALNYASDNFTEIFKSAFQEEMNCYEEYYSDYSFADESETGKPIICPYCGNNQTQKEPYKSKSLGLDYTCLECENEFDESEVNVK